MKKKISLSVLALVVMLTTLFSSFSFAATVGQRLNTPEAGWERYDDTNSAIKYSGKWSPAAAAGLWGGTSQFTNVSGANISFRFKGTKLRIIEDINDVNSNTIKITVDGVSEIYSAYGSSSVYKTLVYEKSGLSDGIHSVTISNSTTSNFGLDAIDIEDTGYLINPDIAVPNLNAVAGTSQIDLNWSAVAGAIGYNVKRSTNAGGPHVTIAASVTGSNYSDFSVIPGITYYYIVTAKNAAGESMNSNEAFATPTVAIPEVPTNLSAVGDNELQSINLNWNSVTGATYYEIRRSIVEGGPYSSIANNIIGTSYNDANVSIDTMYYYVVTAINESGGSENSNEAFASIDNLRRALLTIYISGGQIKEYDLSATELNDFIEWYDAKDAGTGPSKYKFVKTWNKGPFKSRAEYVIFDKILTFDVDEYDVPTEK